jgi:hypothetical protein
VSGHICEPLGVGQVRLAARDFLDVAGVAQPQRETMLEGVVIGSDQGAVSVFRLVRFPGPPTEPDVRLSPHPALHQLRWVTRLMLSPMVWGLFPGSGNG